MTSEEWVGRLDTEFASITPCAVDTSQDQPGEFTWTAEDDRIVFAHTHGLNSAKGAGFVEQNSHVITVEELEQAEDWRELVRERLGI